MIRIASATLIGFAALLGVSAAPANAQRTVTCESRHGDYRECRAHFRWAVIVRQNSKSACIRNRTWGYDRDSGRIWVDRGCRAVFAEGARWRRRDDGFNPYRPRYQRPEDNGGGYYERRRYDQRNDDCLDNGDC
jgi:hypothetical protein